MNDDEAMGVAALFLLAWMVIGNLIGMVLVLLIKPKGRNRFGNPARPCNPIQSLQACMNQFASAAGRASRSEFWWFFLACLILSFILSGLDTALNTHIFRYGNYGFFLPLLTAQIRRLHDIRRTGWWVLLNVTIIPVTLYVLCAWPPSKDEAETAADTF